MVYLLTEIIEVRTSLIVHHRISVMKSGPSSLLLYRYTLHQVGLMPGLQLWHGIHGTAA